MVIYTPYARRKMAKRNITTSDAELVVEDPEITYPSHSHPDREVRVRTIGTRRLAVVVKAQGGDLLVITAYDQTDED